MNLVVKIVLLALIVASCKKSTPDNSVDNVDLSNGILILNEGLFQQNNASITFLDRNSQNTHQNFHVQHNGEMLGDVANDMLRYGSKIYIVLNNSHLLTILDSRTGDLIKKISMTSNGTGRSPRFAVAIDGKVYVSSFDGTVAKIDTASLTIQGYVNVGRNPDGITQSNGKLFVSNSGGLDFPNYDSTVSVIDIASFQEVYRITVGQNPGSILTDSDGDVYLIKRGDYGSDSSRLVRINPNQNTVEHEYSGFNVVQLCVADQKLYFIHVDQNGANPKVGVINTYNNQLETSDLMNLSHVQTMYGIHVDEQRQEIYLMDAHNYSSTGTVYVHSFSGALLQEIQTGYLPKKIIICD